MFKSLCAGFLGMFLMIATTSSLHAQSQPQPRRQPFDPGYYVRIYEETGDRRILLYNPAQVAIVPTLLRIDEESKIVIELDADRLTPDMALNGLFMAAELSRSDINSTPVKVEVLNYSEVAADPKTQASQAGVALRTAGQVHLILQNLYDLTKGIISVIYDSACIATPPSNGQRPAGCSYQLKAGVAAADAEQLLRSHLRAAQPRVDGIIEFLTADANTIVLAEVGATVFNLDVRSLKGMATKLKTDVTTFVTGDPSPQRDRARDDIVLTLEHLWDDMQPLRIATSRDDRYFDNQWTTVLLPHFRQLLAPGTIDLRKYKAADGETLTLTIQARGAGGDGVGGISRDFHFAVKKFHTRVTTEPSAFYVHRLGTVRDDKGQVIQTNFTPAPGVTFGAVFYSRGLALDAAGRWMPRESGWTRLRTALAPGIGLNVSLMNFAANDFDPSVKDSSGQVVGGFRTTDSASIQVGAGVTASLFSNALQVTYGWNLNIPNQRRYWGIGFGFVQIGQEIATFAKKAS